MSDNLFLMMKDIPVIRMHFDTVLYKVLTPSLLPYQKRGKLRHYAPAPIAGMRYNLSQMNIAARKKRRRLCKLPCIQGFAIRPGKCTENLKFIKIGSIPRPFLPGNDGAVLQRNILTG